MSERLLSVVEHLDIRPDDRVLEIGCGTGSFIKCLHPGAEVVGIYPDPKDPLA